MDQNPEVASFAYWDKQYGDGIIPWDLGGPTPVYERLAHSGELAPGRMVVLGAGRGHDARLFAGEGFAVTAVDFSPLAVAEMKRLNEGKPDVDVLQRNIFDLLPEFAGAFDYVLEYTCFCAIDPARREAYFDLVTELLAPEGTYVALAFPKTPFQPGPPFPVSPDKMIDSLSERGLELLRRERPVDSAPGRQDNEELIILQKIVD